MCWINHRTYNYEALLSEAQGKLYVFVRFGKIIISELDQFLGCMARGGHFKYLA